MEISNYFKKVLFLLFCVCVFRFGTHIPIPSINTAVLSEYINQFEGTVVELLNTFSGGSIKRVSILTIGIMPFISASIIVQLFGFFSSNLKKLKEEGEKGAIAINKITRRLTLLIAFFQAISICSFISSQYVPSGESLVLGSGLKFYIITITSLVTGSMFLIWMSDRITDLGIGNGVSVIIFASIVSSLPETIDSIYGMNSNGSLSNFSIVLITLLIVFLFYFISFVETSQRRISLSGNGDYKEKNYLPIKVNLGGIMPSIFASTIIMIPLSINSFLFGSFEFDFISEMKEYFGDYSSVFLINYSILIVFFSFFYVGVTFSSKKIAENLKNNGTFIHGIRPGLETDKFIKALAKRLTLIGSFYMVFVSIFPQILVEYFGIPFYLGGTSLLIIVTVSKDWIEQYKLSTQNKSYKNIKKSLNNRF